MEMHHKRGTVAFYPFSPFNGSKAQGKALHLALLSLWGLLILASTGCDNASQGEATSDNELARARVALSNEGATCVSFQRGAQGGVADTKISNRQPDKFFGNEPVASISSVNGHVEQVLLRFDTQSIPTTASISSATLTVWQTNSGRPTSLKAHAITAAWTENAVSWRSFAGAYAPEVAASVDAPSHTAPRSLDVAALVAQWVQTPESNHGLLLEQQEGKTLVDTSESPHADRRPRLEICYTVILGTPPSGTSLLLEVVDSAGQPIRTAAISAGNAVFPTDSVGRRLFEDLEPGRFTAKVEAEGYTSATAVVELEPGAHVGRRVKLIPLGTPVAFQAEAGAVVETPSVRVAIPPSAVVDALGQPVTGPVELTIAPLDPATQLALMPGPLEGTLDDGTGQTVQLESVFMAEVSLWSQGAPLQLAPGATATLEFTLPDSTASQYQVGDTVPAWWFDLEAGQWREEGVGLIQPSQTQPGKLVWVVEVSHFTWWNADKPWTDKSCVRVLVLDSAGRPVPNMYVYASGVSYQGASAGYTGTDGRGCVDIKRASTAQLTVGPPEEGLSTVVTVTGSADAAACGMSTCAEATLVMNAALCTPGAYEDCPYTGPAGTLGQGQCRAGQRQCNVNGTRWSACVGQVVPVAETCRLPFDEDCDGAVNEDCTCTDTAGVSCYTGPAGTRDVGLCRSGVVACDVFGNEACVGQQQPRQETCATMGDEDCDGVDECAPSYQWTRAITGSFCGFPPDLAVDGLGNALMAALAPDGSIDFGGEVMTIPWPGLFLAKRDGAGQHLWARHIEREAAMWWWDWNEDVVTVDGEGNVVVGGEFSGLLRVGAVVLNSQGSPGLFLLKFSPQGQLLWARAYSADMGSSLLPDSTAVDASGDIFIAGSFSGTLRFGTTAHTHWGGPLAAYVAKVDGSTGEPVWSKSFTATTSIYGVDLAVDATGDALMTGSFSGELTVDGTTLLSVGPSHDTFLTKLGGGTGNALWLRNTGHPDVSDHLPALRIDGSGNAWVMAWTPWGTVSPHPSSYSLTKVDANGDLIWRNSYAPPELGSVQQYLSLSFDNAGNAMISGTYVGTVNFGGGNRAQPSNMSYSAFLAWYGANGNYVTDRIFPVASTNSFGSAYAFGTEPDPAGSLLMLGYFSGTMDFGTGSVQSGPCGSLFLTKFNPTP